MTLILADIELFRKRTKGKETIGYAERVSERIVICGTKEIGGKQERVENMEAKNQPSSKTLKTRVIHPGKMSGGKTSGYYCGIKSTNTCVAINHCPFHK